MRATAASSMALWTCGRGSLRASGTKNCMTWATQAVGTREASCPSATPTPLRGSHTSGGLSTSTRPKLSRIGSGRCRYFS
uniref:Uncharacterized protein n=1 Tax=Ixodes ricinus TaxID=34613 RepID=A0A6B0UD56_IXORI